MFDLLQYPSVAAVDTSTLKDDQRGASVNGAFHPPTAVVIGASSPALAFGLESLVLASVAMRSAAITHSLAHLLECCSQAGDCIALVDPSLGNLDIRDFMQALHAAAPRARVVLITDAHPPHLVSEAIKCGACCLVGTAATADELHAALAAAAAGRRHIAPAIAAHLAESLTLEALTGRETEVLALLSRGACNKSIARQLDVAVGTVKTHLRAIMAKLDARSRTAVVLRAHQLGLVRI